MDITILIFIGTIFFVVAFIAIYIFFLETIIKWKTRVRYREFRRLTRDEPFLLNVKIIHGNENND